MKQYAIQTHFLFDGYFYVNAKNKVQAREYVEKHCGLVLNRGIHSTLSDEVIDWDFPVHPQKSIGLVCLEKEMEYGNEKYHRYKTL